MVLAGLWGTQGAGAGVFLGYLGCVGVLLVLWGLRMLSALALEEKQKFHRVQLITMRPLDSAPLDRGVLNPRYRFC